MILGGVYEKEDAKAMREACKGHLNVPRLMFDKNKPASVPPGPEYAKIVVWGGGGGETFVEEVEGGENGRGFSSPLLNQRFVL